MGREPISDMSHLVVISSFALSLSGSATRDGGRMELWVFVCVPVRLQYRCAQCVQYIHN